MTDKEKDLSLNGMAVFLTLLNRHIITEDDITEIEYPVALFIELYLLFHTLHTEAVGADGVGVARHIDVTAVHIHLLRDVCLLRLLEFTMIVLEGRVAKYGLEEVAADGKCRARTLSELSGTEVDTAVFATDPCTAD